VPSLAGLDVVTFLVSLFNVVAGAGAGAAVKRVGFDGVGGCEVEEGTEGYCLEQGCGDKWGSHM